MSDYICPHTCSYRTHEGRCGMTGGYENCQYIKYFEKIEKWANKDARRNEYDQRRDS